MKFLTICLIPIIFSGCATPIDTSIGVPPRPNLIPISQLDWKRIRPETQDVIQHNDLALKEHIRKLEGRIILHDASL